MKANDTHESRQKTADVPECSAPSDAPINGIAPCAIAAESCHDEESGRTVSHWPLKLRLAPLDDPSLKNADLLICGDCTAFATRHFHDRLSPGTVLLIGCPKFEDPRMLTAKLEELFTMARPASCAVVRMEKPCCKGLDTVCRDAAKKVEAPFPIREIVVYCSGRVDVCGCSANPPSAGQEGRPVPGAV